MYAISLLKIKLLNAAERKIPERTFSGSQFVLGFDLGFSGFLKDLIP